MKCVRLAVVVCVLLAVAGPARADEASKREKVQELFAILHMDRTVQQVMDGMMQLVTAMTQQMAGTTKLSPEMTAKLNDFQKQLFALVSDQVSWDKLKPEYTELYAGTYTEEELDAILAFYRSPAGAAMVTKTPELLSKSMAMNQERMSKVTPQLMQMLQDFAKSVAPPSRSTATPAPQ